MRLTVPRALASGAAGIAALVVIAGGAGTPPDDAAVDGTVIAAAGAQALPGSYIVVLKRGRTPVQQRAMTLSRRFGGTVQHLYGAALPGFSVRLTAGGARKLAGHPDVASVEADAVIGVAGVQRNPPSWGLDRIDQVTSRLDRTYRYAGSAAGVTVYVIDTGIRTGHQDFGGRARTGFDAVGGGRDGVDCNGHGTHVAGTAGGARFGVAKGVKLVGVRVLDCAGRGAISQVIAGLDWVTRHAVRPAVANLSLGGGLSGALDAAVRRSIGAGITYVVAAGNDGVDACGSSPARVREALTVGASDERDARASFSNGGRCLDLFAPGVRITSAWHSSGSASRALSGTSMAAPHVAGAAALVLARQPGASPAAVRAALVGAATQGAVHASGQGSPDRLLCTAGVPATATPRATPGERPAVPPWPRFG